MRRGVWIVFVLILAVAIISFYSSDVQLAPRQTGERNTLPCSGGSGTAQDPIRVCTAWDLNNVRYNMTAHYKQINDIDLSILPEDWTPIGNFFNGFVGSYDGNHKEIRNLKIVADPSESEQLGLFGQLGNHLNSEDSAIVQGVIIRNASILGGYQIGILAGNVINTLINDVRVIDSRIEAEGIAGGLVGQGFNFIINSSSVESLAISNSSILHSASFGGIIGSSNVANLYGLTADHNIISKSFVKNTSIKGNEQLGGLAGIYRGTIVESYAYVNIEKRYEGSGTSGGLVGYIDNAIRTDILDSYSFGSIFSPGYSPNTSGGVAGNVVAWFSDGNNLTVKNTYSYSIITSPSQQGGLIGEIGGDALEYIKVTNSYWDMQTSGQNTSAGGEGRTTAEMTAVPQTSKTYAGWDFTNIWKQINGQYPKLKW